MKERTEPSRIIDNPSPKELRQQLEAFGSFERFFRALPFAKRLFPRLDKVFASFAELKEQAEILEIPDEFNSRFAQRGWIAYESMNLDVMKEAISIADSKGTDEAEEFLANSYNAEYIRWGIMRFHGHREFRRRIRLAELAMEDYVEKRYHACVPLLLSLLDGLVNDVSKHVGFFAENAELTAWDCIAAHESGLQSLARVMGLGRPRTNEEPISIPYRHGILHGRELAFDNKLVAAKCWAALFAARDWAGVIEQCGKDPVPKVELSWRELLKQLKANAELRSQLEKWRPRSADELAHLPCAGNPNDLPPDSPERAVAKFLENWREGRYGPMGEALLYFTNDSPGKKAGRAKQDFSTYRPARFVVQSVTDQAPSASHVEVDLEFVEGGRPILKQVSVRAIFQGQGGEPAVRSAAVGSWKIVQNSFSSVIYSIGL